MPKSSRDSNTPMSLSSRSTSRARLARSMTALSVISSMRFAAGSPVASKARRTMLATPGTINCLGDRFTLTMVLGRCGKASSQSLS